MRLEYKIGIVVILGVFVAGAYFFATRDRGMTPQTAQSPAKTETVANKPTAGQTKQASPRPASPAVNPAPSGLARTEPKRDVAPPAAAPTLTLDPARSTTPGIRSETPIASPTPSDAPVAANRPITPTAAPTTQPTPAPNPSLAISTTPPARIAPTPTAVVPTPAPTAAVTPTNTISSPEATKMHALKSGETISGLSKQYYGSEKYTKLIMDANPTLKDPRKIKPGTQIVIPPAPAKAGIATAKTNAPTPHKDTAVAPVAPSTPPAGTKSYIVKEGDNWQKIAQEYMGKASDWPQLFEMNKKSPHERPQILKPGTTILVPIAKSENKTSSANTTKTPTLMGTSNP